VDSGVGESTLQWLALTLTPGLGPTRSRRLVEYMGSIAAVFRASLTELEAAVDSVLQKFLSEGPTPEEMQKATSGAELSFLSGLESNLGKANQLIDGSVFHGDPGYFKTEYQKTMSVTAADVKRVANQYLGKGRVVLSVVPKGKKDQASKPGESETITEQRTTATQPANARGGK